MTPVQQAEARLRAFALGYPEAHEDLPWGHYAFKVKGKSFVFMSKDGDVVSVSVKLPTSCESALLFPFAEPTGYGLGRSGWVSAKFAAGEEVPFSLLERWIDESYRAVAPKKLVASLDGAPAPAAKKSATPKAAKSTTTARKSK